MSSNGSTMLLKKRERTQNWVPEEKNALFALIKSHVNAIENKKIDAATSAMKTIAWQQIYTGFRRKFSTDRDITRMREQWRRMKAQARMEMHAFTEKVKSLHPEEAIKCRPSNLSIEVWKLLEKTRKNEGDDDRSDETEQEATESSSNLQTIFDMLTSTEPEMVAKNEIKIEEDSDEYNSEEEVNPRVIFEEQSNNLERKRPRIMENESMYLYEEKNPSTDILNHNEDGASLSNSNEGGDRFTREQKECMKRTMRMFEVSQREHELKLSMLNIELERAELQKQTAINELKTSEIKKLLIESQAIEYYSHVRMAGERGSGAGKGGGGGGSIREAGGSFGKMEAAHEDQYFYNLQKEQLQKLKDDLHDEISFHEEQIKRHQEAINRHKQRITDMDKK